MIYNTNLWESGQSLFQNNFLVENGRNESFFSVYDKEKESMDLWSGDSLFHSILNIKNRDIFTELNKNKDEILNKLSRLKASGWLTGSHEALSEDFFTPGSDRRKQIRVISSLEKDNEALALNKKKIINGARESLSGAPSAAIKDVPDMTLYSFRKDNEALAPVEKMEKTYGRRLPKEAYEYVKTSSGNKGLESALLNNNGAKQLFIKIPNHFLKSAALSNDGVTDLVSHIRNVTVDSLAPAAKKGTPFGKLSLSEGGAIARKVFSAKSALQMATRLTPQGVLLSVAMEAAPKLVESMRENLSKSDGGDFFKSLKSHPLGNEVEKLFSQGGDGASALSSISKGEAATESSPVANGAVGKLSSKAGAVLDSALDAKKLTSAASLAMCTTPAGVAVCIAKELLLEAAIDQAVKITDGRSSAITSPMSSLFDSVSEALAFGDEDEIEKSSSKLAAMKPGGPDIGQVV